ncbi:MAG: glycoside hydrolase family 30 protein [Sediminibacterium sp.]|nr:glycoside hydrolase family 30 protein [Sediminibacterium sp.]
MKNLSLCFAFILQIFPQLIWAQSKNELVSVAGKKVVIYSTAENTDLRLSFTGTANFKTLKQPMETQICVFVDPSTTFQSYIGIGGAITDAAAETFAKLSKKNQQDLLAAYFSKENGIGYTIARTNINSCDFSSDMYTYIKDGDKLLQSFSIDHDLKYKIPFIKQATAAAGGKLQLFASPWSPPAFMKDNNNMLQGGKLSANYYQSWASYYTKFIKAYEKEGMPIWGISVQNEPMAKQKWESCIYTAEEERDFIKNYLGPTMQKAGYGNKKIIAWDHNRDLIFQRAQTYFNDPIASKYIWGIGFHWYENWSGGEPMYDNVKRVQESFPNKKLFFTEGCVERYEISRLNDWALGERYGKSMINDFNNGMVGFTDWNILLDENGGPNHVQNFCFAPVHGDVKNDRLIFTNSYYYIGHFSKFIQQGAKRISSSASRSKLLTTAFKNSNGKSVVIVMNQDKESVPFFLWVNGEAAELNALPHSILTLIY